MNRKLFAFGINIDAITMEEAIVKCIELAKQRKEYLSFVVTPNINHLVKLESNSDFYEAYKSASLVVVDGRPVKSILALANKSIPEVIPGSDLVPNILNRASDKIELKVYLLGAGPGVAEKAIININKLWPKVLVVGYLSPPIGFENDPMLCNDIITHINDSNPDLIIVGLGAPKQEIWINKHKQHIRAGLAICAGATIDFIAGDKKRAPIYLQKLSLEWLYRIYTEPKRLFKRYLFDSMCLPYIIYKELFK
ncbi:MAG: WecB/TagA/CpsF family glycosyltransferase [Methylicorpusculum sp.]|uniref:WecB/TagA/CpsF family glycosyltransferase n=1 Tax=Methylicorpusculum sp. TaxID=2713644 RepID=UPI0027312BED|nr:WecB/TagA/CpsF family glycosyltransferase [Methylicorpusculum sp.]MDP2180848.1 WecB/TagA/CpsF family glycosyltransferase [Methylicorpusculum sp.]